jgi:hypothetical protein
MSTTVTINEAQAAYTVPSMSLSWLKVRCTWSAKADESQ